uniref:otolith matrix protein OMM-64-like n=1 Tax=Erigeron canadensis TaxID=72917 RepID=UPI001CB98C9B|nr:otolith matrix protein OMM-64-like [Erigeron canadensis]
MESRIQEAMRSRLQHFRDQSDSLTFEGVRRLLEKDLALDTYALDPHKKFVKHLLEKYLSGTEDDDDVSKGSKQNKLEDVKMEELPKEYTVTADESTVGDSPVMELSSAKESAKSGSSETQGNADEKIPTETMIKEALWNKATYFRSNSEELTVAGVRRLLEEDLDLKKFSLDSFKKLISKQLDEVLNFENDSPKKRGSKLDADGENDHIEAEVKPKKKLAPKAKVNKSEGPRKRNRPAHETKRGKKKIKNDEENSVEKNYVKDVDDESESSAEKPVKKEVVSYGKKVERLRSIIKACGMSIGPNVYKKAKQAPEDKREAFLLKELQNILSKEGLSANPSEKEIKEVKRRKERAKELEGIDTSNIVVGSRRRSAFDFVAPPKPKAPIESDDDDDDDAEDSDNEEGNGSEDTDNDNGNGSQDTDNDNKDGDDIHEVDTLHKDGDDLHEDDTLRDEVQESNTS